MNRFFGLMNHLNSCIGKAFYGSPFVAREEPNLTLYNFINNVRHVLEVVFNLIQWIEHKFYL